MFWYLLFDWLKCDSMFCSKTHSYGIPYSREYLFWGIPMRSHALRSCAPIRTVFIILIIMYVCLPQRQENSVFWRSLNNPRIEKFKNSLNQRQCAANSCTGFKIAKKRKTRFGYFVVLLWLKSLMVNYFPLFPTSPSFSPSPPTPTTSQIIIQKEMRYYSISFHSHKYNIMLMY